MQCGNISSSYSVIPIGYVITPGQGASALTLPLPVVLTPTTIPATEVPLSAPGSLQD